MCQDSPGVLAISVGGAFNTGRGGERPETSLLGGDILKGIYKTDNENDLRPFGFCPVINTECRVDCVCHIRWVKSVTKGREYHFHCSHLDVGCELTTYEQNLS